MTREQRYIFRGEVELTMLTTINPSSTPKLPVILRRVKMRSETTRKERGMKTMLTISKAFPRVTGLT